MSKVIAENMWCFHCEHNWDTEDYHACISCPNCYVKPVRIYRTSSTTYAYAYMEKHPEIREEQDKKVKQFNDALDKAKSIHGDSFEYKLRLGTTVDLGELKSNEAVCSSGIDGYHILMTEKVIQK